MPPNNIACNFCGKPRNEVRALLEGQGVHICDRCVKSANEEFSASFKAASAKEDDGPLPTPMEIVAFLDDYVIGQDLAKQHLAAGVYRHYQKRKIRKSGKDLGDLALDKSNMLIAGPSGCGKTELARSIAKMLNVPFYVGDATKLTQAGYVGDDVDTLLQGLLEKADWNVERAQWGIIVIDEIDKIARKSGSRGAGYRDVSGEGVQQALLKIVEGGEVTIAKGKGAKLVDATQQPSITIDTSNILFIGMGSFAGIEEVVNARLNRKAAVGFGAESRRKDVSTAEVYANLDEDDVLEFGIIPELSGRFPIQTGVLSLTEDQLVHILTRPKGAIIKQVQRLYEEDGVSLTFDEDALRIVAQKAAKRKTGARALRGVVSKLLLPYDLKTPSSDISAIRFTAAAVNGEAEPVITHRPTTVLEA